MFEKLLKFMFIFAGWLTQSHSLPTTCPDTDMKNNARLSVVQKITYLALPAAVGLKNILGTRIFRGRQSLDDQRPVDGFPVMPSSIACPVCNVYECFANDCVPLMTLMHFISANMPSRYSASIRRLADVIRIINERMGCSAVRSSLVGNRWRHKENNYRIAKDTVKFLRTLANRYRGYICISQIYS